MTAQPEKFWTEDPCILFTNIRLFPLKEMTKDEKLNAVTRLAIAASAGMYFMKYDFWFTFLLLSLLIIVILKYNAGNEGFSMGGSGSGSGASETTPVDLKENFSLVPTYANPDYHTTTITPIFSEEWQIYPPVYDTYVNTPDPNITFKAPLQPQSYPYGQYLTRTNLLPSDEEATHMLNGGPRQAREYVNTAFTRNQIGFRENMTRLYKKRLARKYRSNCNDDFSPYQSY